MKGLVLPGYACTSQIWAPLRQQLEARFEVDWVDWPHELTPEFHSVTAFVDWLYPAFRQGCYDFVIGHSLRGDWWRLNWLAGKRPFSNMGS